MKVGYARVSTDDQNSSLQRDALQRAGCDIIFADEGVSGTTASRPSLDRALAALKEGDTLVTWRLDRLGRSLANLISIVTRLEHRGVAFNSLTEAIDTRTASGRLLFHVMGALAEFERSLISERTRAGLDAARRRGAPLGRPNKLSEEQVRAAIVEMESGRISLRALAHRLGVSPATVERAIRRS